MCSGLKVIMLEADKRGNQEVKILQVPSCRLLPFIMSITTTIYAEGLFEGPTTRQRRNKFFQPSSCRQSAKYYYCYGGIGLTAAWPSEATRRGVSNLIVDEIGSADVMAGFCDDGCETDATVPMPSLQASLNPDVTGMDLNCIAKRPQWGVRSSYCTTSHCEKVRKKLKQHRLWFDHGQGQQETEGSVRFNPTRTGDTRLEHAFTIISSYKALKDLVCSPVPVKTRKYLGTICTARISRFHIPTRNLPLLRKALLHLILGRF